METTQLIAEAVAIKWLIYVNGGNACKSAVEDVLMARHDGLTRYVAHEVMNHIEFHQVALGSFLHSRWQESTPEPQMEAYPEIKTCDIRWYRGRPE